MFFSAIKKFIKQNNYPGFKLKAVFFDMDGVLFDSMPSHSDAWIKTLNDLQLPFSIEEAYMNEGRTGDSTINDIFLRYKGRKATEEEIRDIYRLKTKYFEGNGKVKRMPYALELLETIKSQGLIIFIVTGSGQISLLDNLSSNFPDIFSKEKMVTAFDVKNGKPSPEPYLKALYKSGVEPWEVVVVENAPLGVQASVAAGLFTIAVNTGPLSSGLLKEKGADVVLDGGIRELNELWNQFPLEQI